MDYVRGFLSIIVPTRERPDTLKHCLRTIVSQSGQNVEIIVSDNQSGAETKRVVESFDDTRIRYIRPEKRLGMSEHWEFALGHMRGEWVTFIGDDDGLLPDAVKKIFSITKKYPEAKAIQTRLCKFIWPAEGDEKSGKLSLVLEKGDEYRISKIWLSKLLCAETQFAELPYIYTGGFLHAEVIETVKEKSGGTFFLSMIPDVYSAIVAALTLDKYVYSYEPFAVAGLSAHSNGNNMRSWKEESIKKIHFFNESAIGFHPTLGTGIVQSMPIYIYEAFLRAQPLHNGKVLTSLETQLALAIVHADRYFKKDVQDYCKALADLNALDYKEIERKIPYYRFQRKRQRFIKNIKRFSPFHGRQIKAIKDPLLKNVYDAAQCAGLILKE